MGNKKQIFFELTNTSDEVKSVRLFGYSKHLNSLNFGNDTHIRLNAICNSHQQSLIESAFSPCMIEQIRLLSSNTRNIEQLIQVVSEDGFGCVNTMPIQFKIGQYQFQEDITELNTLFKLDYNTYLEFKIQPNSSMNIYFWGEAIDRVDYMPTLNPTLSQIAKLFFKKLFKLK